MLCFSITRTSRMTRSCRAYLSFTEEIRTSKFRSAPRRWQSMVMSSESSIRFGRSESQRSAIKSEQLLVLHLEGLHRRREGRLQESLLSYDDIPTLLLTGTRY